MEVVAERNVMRIMDPKAGDLKIEWDQDRPDEVAHARKCFDEAQKKGMLIYKMTRGGSKGDVLTAFDPTAERIIATPRYVGG